MQVCRLVLPDCKSGRSGMLPWCLDGKTLISMPHVPPGGSGYSLFSSPCMEVYGRIGVQGKRQCHVLLSWSYTHHYEYPPGEQYYPNTLAGEGGGGEGRREQHPREGTGLDKSGVRTPGTTRKRLWATRIRGLVAQWTTKISQFFF